MRVRDLNESFIAYSQKNIHSRKLRCTFDSPEKLAPLSLLKEGKPSPDRKMIKRLTFDNLFPPKTRSKITTAITFSRQNDVG